FDGTQDRLYYNDIVTAGMQWYGDDCRIRGDHRLCYIKDLTFAFRDRVVCLTAIGREQQLAEIEQAVQEQHAKTVETHLFENRYSPGWHWLTVHDRRATKDQAIRIVINEWGLEGSELVVFGDNINDLKMFRLADRAIAVENAIEQVKAAATEVIGSNSEDSVVRFIRDDWETQTDDDP
ncbi:MAG: HAD hydrolase family protein, partial [Anaerolineae bacterium]|nr:HAD hydrolase family protein [Anaerolineae bacterium]